MKRKQAKKSTSPLIRLVGLEVALAATGIAGSLAAATVQAAPGDLDPAFGDVGRQSDLGFSSILWSTDVAPDGSIFASAGECEYYGYYYDCIDENFSTRLLATGAIAADFLAVPLENSIVYDSARQADGRLVEVGRVRLADGSEKMQVSRRLPDGTLDPGFGLNGKVWIGEGTTANFVGRSIIVDADQRIVVAGSRGFRLMVVRLLPDGTLDPGFATGGIYLQADSVDANIVPPRIVAAPGNGYRVSSITKVSAASTSATCAVTALDGAGVVDASYGQGGTAGAPSLPGNSEPVQCWTMALAPDGSMLLGGRQGASAYLQRLLPGGTAAAALAGGELDSRLSFVNAIAAPTGDRIYVTGSARSSLASASVLRLQADGTLDEAYGQGGIAQVAIRASRTSYHSIQDLQAGPGDTLVAGGYAVRYYERFPFVARLLGDSGPGGPGLLSLQQDPVLVAESGPPAVLKVSRIGGSSGAIAVSYRARDRSDLEPGNVANGGADYTQVTGRLTWVDGDVSEREIAVPIASDAVDEQPEYFEVVLEAVEGGAGLATTGADIEIAGSSYPAGLVSIGGDALIGEGIDGGLYLIRSQYAVGAISVTVRVAGGTAAPGADFSSTRNNQWQDVVVTWADGESGGKFVPIYARLDDREEPSETVQFELSAPTGGANLDPVHSQVVVTIEDRTFRTSGGGSFGWLATMLLGLAGLWRRLSRS